MQKSFVRRILPPLAERPEPTPEMFLAAVMNAEKARKNQQLSFIAQIVLGLAALFALAFFLFRRRSCPRPSD